MAGEKPEKGKWYTIQAAGKENRKISGPQKTQGQGGTQTTVLRKHKTKNPRAMNEEGSR